MHKEDIKELPSEEEQWEVPEPAKPDINLERGTEDTHTKLPKTIHHRIIRENSTDLTHQSLLTGQVRSKSDASHQHNSKLISILKSK